MTDKIKQKKAKCPKCDRFCSVAQLVEGEWKETGSKKKKDDTVYRVTCPGCGAVFYADIKEPIPCWEEEIEQYNPEF